MRGVFLHILSDAIGSVIVIATALVALLVEGYDWLKLYLDPCLRWVHAAPPFPNAMTTPFQHHNGLPHGVHHIPSRTGDGPHPAIGSRLQTTPKFIKVEKLKAELLKIVAVHEFHVWRLVGERIIATVHRFVPSSTTITSTAPLSSPSPRR